MKSPSVVRQVPADPYVGRVPR